MITVREADSGYEVLVYVGTVNIALEDTNALRITEKGAEIPFEYVGGVYKIPPLTGSRLKVTADTKQFGKIETEFYGLQSAGKISEAEISNAYSEGVNALE